MLAGPGAGSVIPRSIARSGGLGPPAHLGAAVDGALLAEAPDPSAAEVKEYLAGNLCRCGSYVKILDAVLDAKHRLPRQP